MYKRQVIKNISENTITWERYLNGNDLFYNTGKVGIFGINDSVLNPVDKLHLASGNFILQRPLIDPVGGERSNALYTPPAISISTTRVDNAIRENLFLGITYVSSNQSTTSSYSSLKADNLSLDIRSTDDLFIRSETGDLSLNSASDTTITAQGKLALQPSDGDYHGDLIIYDQSLETDATSTIGQIAIGHGDPRFWLDIRRLPNIFDKGLESWDSEGSSIIDKFMVNFQQGDLGQLKLLSSTGELFEGVTDLAGTKKLFDIKNEDTDEGEPTSSYLTLLANKKLGIDDYNPSQSLTAKGNVKLFGSKPTIYLGQEKTWYQNVDATGNTTNDFKQQISEINFLGASEATHSLTALT